MEYFSLLNSLTSSNSFICIFWVTRQRYALMKIKENTPEEIYMLSQRIKLQTLKFMHPIRQREGHFKAKFLKLYYGQM